MSNMSIISLTNPFSVSHRTAILPEINKTENLTRKHPDWQITSPWFKATSRMDALKKII